MKKFAIGMLALVVLTAGVVFVFAQKRGAGPERGFGKSAFPPFILDKIADEIGLSDEQRGQIKQILETEKPKIQTLLKTTRETHRQLEKLGTDGVFNEALVAVLAARQAENTKQLIVEKEKTKAAVFAVLTAEQRAKAEQMRERFKGKMRERMGKHGFGGGFSEEF